MLEGITHPTLKRSFGVVLESRERERSIMDKCIEILKQEYPSNNTISKNHFLDTDRCYKAFPSILRPISPSIFSILFQGSRQLEVSYSEDLDSLFGLAYLEGIILHTRLYPMFCEKLIGDKEYLDYLHTPETKSAIISRETKGEISEIIVSQEERNELIDMYEFPQEVIDLFLHRGGIKAGEELEEIVTGLKELYKNITANGGEELDVPSESVDLLWHSHILYTKAYREFCYQIGKTIHHIPKARPHISYPSDSSSDTSFIGGGAACGAAACGCGGAC